MEDEEDYYVFYQVKYSKKMAFSLLNPETFTFNREQKKNGESTGLTDVMNNIHQRKQSEHQEELDKIEKCRKISKGGESFKCNKGHNCKGDCQIYFEKEREKMCPSNCHCQFMCSCGWYSEKNNESQISKHLQKAVDCYYITNVKRKEGETVPPFIFKNI